MRFAAYIVALALLTGCGLDQARRDNMLANARSVCLRAGFSPGSDDLARCTMNQYRQMSRPVTYGYPTPPAQAPHPTTTVCTPSQGSVYCTTQ